MQLTPTLFGKPVRNDQSPQYRAGIALEFAIVSLALFTAWTVLLTHPLGNALHVALLGLMIIVSGNRHIKISTSAAYGWDTAFRIAAIAILPAAGMAAVALIIIVVGFALSKTWLNAVARVASELTSLAAIGLGIWLVGLAPLDGTPYFIALALAGFAFSAAHDQFVFPVMVYAAFDRDVLISQLMKEGTFHQGMMLMSAAIEIPVAIIVLELQRGSILLTLFPFAALLAASVMLNRQFLITRQLDQRNSDLHSASIRIAAANLQFAVAMVRALDASDAYTAGHSAAVAVYSRDIARELRLNPELVRNTHLSALLHDIGKIGIPANILNKAGRFTEEEELVMQRHAEIGATILGEVDAYSEIALNVRYHHERIDGTGYPEGVVGDAIPLTSRIISVADTYSAMTTDRPYRNGMDPEKAISILQSVRGTQLDSEIVDAFCAILARMNDDYRRARTISFETEAAGYQSIARDERGNIAA